MDSSEIALEHTPISKLVPQITGPIAFALILSGLYNVVDAIFIVNGVNEYAFGAVSLVLPIQMTIFALADLIGSGAGSMIARSFGAGKIETARKIAGLAFYLMFSVALLFTLLAYLFLDDILGWLSVTAEMTHYAKEYATPLILFSMVIFASTLLNHTIRSQGKAITMMVIVLTASALNIIFDALFIFGLNMGVSGAAYATVLSQLVAIIISLVLVTKGRLVIYPVFRGVNDIYRSIIEMIALGFPLFLAIFGVSLSMAMVNGVIVEFTDVNRADDLFVVYGIIGRLFIFCSMVPLAMMIGLQTIASYNYGAKNYERVRQTLLVTSLYSVGYGVIISLGMFFFPRQILALFTSDVQLIDQAVIISKITFLGFSLFSCTMMISGLYQSIGYAKSAVIIASSRVYIFMVPLIFILPYYKGELGIWLVFPLADALAFFVAVTFLFCIKLAKEEDEGSVGTSYVL